MKHFSVKSVLFIIFVLSLLANGCGGGGGGGWSSGDITPTPTSAGSVDGYVYQNASAATRDGGRAAGRTILVPISGATVSVGGVTATTNSSGYYTATNVPQGAQTVSINATGFSSVSLTVNVTAGSTVTATQQNDGTYALTPVSSGQLDITTSPSGAGVYIGGVNLNTTSPNTLTLAAASYELTISKDGYENVSQTVTIAAGGTQSLDLTLPLKITAATATPSNLTVSAGSTQTPSLSCTFSDGSTGTCHAMTWTSQNTSVATVDSASGQVTGVAAGSTTIVGTRSASDVSVAIPVSVLSSGDTVQSAYITSGGSGGSLTLSNGGTASFDSTCVYSVSGSAACDSSCSWSSSNTSAATITSGGALTCTSAGGATTVKLTCGTVESNSMSVACATVSTSTILRVHGAPDTDGDGEADAAYASTVSLDPGTDLIVRVKVENATTLTGFRTDLNINGAYILPKTETDATNCSAYSNLAYDTSQVCISNFGSALSPSNPLFGISTIDAAGFVVYESGSTVQGLTCKDTSTLPTRLDCALSTRKESDVQPSASGSDYFVYFILGTSASATSGTSTTISIDPDTRTIYAEDGVEVNIDDAQAYSLTVTFL